MPTFSAAIALFFIYASVRADPRAWPVLAAISLLAAAIGAGAGYASAHHTTVRVAAATRPAARRPNPWKLPVPPPSGPPAYDVFTRGSYVTLAIWIGALVLRLAARFLAPHDLAGTTIANAAVITLLATSIGVVRARTYLVARTAIATGSARTTDAA